MRNSLRGKLVLSYLAVAFIVVAVVIGFIYLNSGQSLMTLLIEQQTSALKDSIESYYEEYETLDGFFGFNPNGDFRWENGDRTASRPPWDQPEFARMRDFCGVTDANGYALVPMKGFRPGERIPDAYFGSAVKVAVDGETIAWILPDQKKEFDFNAEEKVYLSRLTKAVALAGLSGVALAILFGVLISSGILKPIRRLTAASKAMADGALEQSVEISSQDEIGQLTDAFNRMSADLARVDAERKRLTADITHDLSTPLQIISGYIEMLEDETLQLTPKRIQIIKSELDHLRRLVSDLTLLSQAEGGAMTLQIETFDVGELLDRIRSAYKPIAAAQDVTMRFDCGDEDVLLTADPGRVFQTVQNLVENALRYTPKDGEVRIALTADAESIRISVSDTGSGIDPEDLPFVFNRFYRADKSRDANSGKMGLGLSICKALTVAQGGEISVRSAGKGTGTTFELKFPRGLKANRNVYKK